MKVKIWLDVAPYGYAFVAGVQPDCPSGQSNMAIAEPLKDYKRYLVSIEVPDPYEITEIRAESVEEIV